MDRRITASATLPPERRVEGYEKRGESLRGRGCQSGNLLNRALVQLPQIVEIALRYIRPWAGNDTSRRLAPLKPARAHIALVHASRFLVVCRSPVGARFDTGSTTYAFIVVLFHDAVLELFVSTLRAILNAGRMLAMIAGEGEKRHRPGLIHPDFLNATKKRRSILWQVRNDARHTACFAPVAVLIIDEKSEGHLYASLRTSARVSLQQCSPAMSPEASFVT